MKILASVVAIGAAIAFAGPSAVSAQQTLSIVTGGTGGVYYPLGGGLASILTKNLPGVNATAEVTGGSVDNLKLLGAGRADVGFSMVDAALDALNGQDKFRGAATKVRTLAVLYPNQMHVVTVDGTGIRTMADLKGKRISTGSTGSATEVMAFRLIEAAGLDRERDMRRERLGVAESVNALKDRKIDAFFWVGGIPTAAVTDLAATPGSKLVLIDHANLVQAMNAKHGPLYAASEIPAGSYAGQTAGNRNISVWNLLVTDERMSEQTAYTVVKTMFDRLADMVAVHGEARAFKLENQRADFAGGVPFHPGALRFFAERGVRVN
jgi:hypothetical protein